MKKCGIHIVQILGVEEKVRGLWWESVTNEACGIENTFVLFVYGGVVGQSQRKKVKEWVLQCECSPLFDCFVSYSMAKYAKAKTFRHSDLLNWMRFLELW